MRYERRVHGELSGRYSTALARYGGAPWISFLSSGSGSRRWAEPDGLLLDWKRGLVVIVEVKIKHSTRAWWGLRGLYEPVVEQLFGLRWQVACCEVCNYYDTTVRWPEPHRMVREPSDLKAGEIGVHIWRA